MKSLSIQSKNNPPSKKFKPSLNLLRHYDETEIVTRLFLH